METWYKNHSLPSWILASCWIQITRNILQGWRPLDFVAERLRQDSGNSRPSWIIARPWPKKKKDGKEKGVHGGGFANPMKHFKPSRGYCHASSCDPKLKSQVSSIWPRMGHRCIVTWLRWFLPIFSTVVTSKYYKRVHLRLVDVVFPIMLSLTHWWSLPESLLA